MFYIDSFNRDEDMTFDEAVRIVTRSRDVGLLENMINLEQILLEVRDSYDRDDRIDEFYNGWHYEINAFNKVHSDMSKLFAPQ